MRHHSCWQNVLHHIVLLLISCSICSAQKRREEEGRVVAKVVLFLSSLFLSPLLSSPPLFHPLLYRSSLLSSSFLFSLLLKAFVINAITLCDVSYFLSVCHYHFRWNRWSRETFCVGRLLGVWTDRCSSRLHHRPRHCRTCVIIPHHQCMTSSASKQVSPWGNDTCRPERKNWPLFGDKSTSICLNRISE